MIPVPCLGPSQSSFPVGRDTQERSSGHTREARSQGGAGCRQHLSGGPGRQHWGLSPKPGLPARALGGHTLMDSAHLGHCVYAGPANRDSGERPPAPKQPLLPTIPTHKCLPCPPTVPCSSLGHPTLLDVTCAVLLASENTSWSTGCQMSSPGQS